MSKALVTAPVKWCAMIDGANQTGTQLRTDGWRPGTWVHAGERFETQMHNWSDGKEHPRYAPQRIYVTDRSQADESGRMTISVRELEHLTVNNDLLTPVL